MTDLRKASLCLSLAVVAGTALWIWSAHQAVLHEPPAGSGQACTADAMLCPDGSYVGRTGPDCEFAPCPISPSWLNYSAPSYGVSFHYPPNWQKTNGVLNAVTPYVFFGNPLNGTTTYSVKFFIYNNPQNLSASAYVKQMLADDAATDASNSANGPAPQTTPHFDRAYDTVVGGYPAYELYNVFAFDHNEEQVYVQHNTQMVLFTFPVADANPNIASSSENNATAHQIISTLMLDPVIGKFCGGIAAFPCATGYSCALDGTYPDAGGHCVSASTTVQ